ncbi:hypothetical protein RDABS01_027443 [Bienertia sinuspersici]
MVSQLPTPITRILPPEWSTCVGSPMEEPYLGIMHPLIHKMEVQMLTWMEPPPEKPKLLLTMTMPLDIKPIIRVISEAFIDTLPSIPNIMYQRYPNLAPNLTPISLMVWNVQGAGSKAFLAALKEIIRVHKPTVIALVETHMDDTCAEQIARQIAFSGHIRVDAEGFSGGIWIYWRSEVVDVHDVVRSRQHITMQIQRNGEDPWFFSAIYASPNPIKRKDLWDHLKSFAASNNIPWVLGGDFNETRYNWERSSSCEEVQRRSRNFDLLIDELELLERKCEDTRRSARLDRFLCNSEWASRFSNAHVKHLPAIQSDHCLIIISPNGFVPLHSTNKPFRFQAAWLTHEKFQEFVDSNWSNDIPLVPFLKQFSEKLQAWNGEVFHNIFRKKKELLARISGAQKKLATGYDGALVKLESKLRRELDDILYQEELLWYQKSRVEWIRDGDRNTSFFHFSTIKRRWRNRIVAIKDNNDNWIYEPQNVKNHISNYFKELYTDDGSNCDHDLPRGLSMRQTNAAFLTKIGWRMLSNPTSLWSRVLRSKYCRGRCDVDMFVPSSNSSNLWKGITENATTIRKGVQLAIGNGKQTLFWDHAWAMNQPLIELAIKPIPEEILGATVFEMWEFGSSWKWDKFAEFLPLSVLKTIQSLEVVLDDDAHDTFFWNGSSDSEFTIKSAIKMMKQNCNEANDPH